jgi:hypothetical protein
MSLYGAFLGAIALERGDARSAGAVLFPALERLEDDRWLYEISRDQRRFTTSARRGSPSISSPVSRGSRNARRSRSSRGTWTSGATTGRRSRSGRPASGLARGKMNRRAAMDFLLHRLRLLNCFQGGQPGDLGYGCTMHWEPEGMVDAAWGLNRGKTEVINPYLQLTRFPLTVADIPQLASYLEDERFILAVSFWRDFHPSRHLHQVNEVVASLIDGLVQRDLCRVEELVTLDPKGRKARIAAWLYAINSDQGRSPCGNSTRTRRGTCQTDWCR